MDHLFTDLTVLLKDVPFLLTPSGEKKFDSILTKLNHLLPTSGGGVNSVVKVVVEKLNSDGVLIGNIKYIILFMRDGGGNNDSKDSKDNKDNSKDKDKDNSSKDCKDNNKDNNKIIKLKYYIDLCKLLTKIIEINRDICINLKLQDSLIILSKSTLAISNEKTKDTLNFQRLIWNINLIMLSITPIPNLSQLTFLREGVELFLYSTLHVNYECLHNVDLNIPAVKFETDFVYPEFICSDLRLIDTLCRCVSKLADTDIAGALDAPLWSNTSIVALLRLMNHVSPDLRLQSLLAIGNLLAGSDLQTDSVLNSGFLKAVAPLVTDESYAVRKESFWSLSNITAGSTAQIKLVLEADNIMQKAINAFANDDERQDIRSETAWLVCNALCGSTPDQRHIMIEMDVLTACVKFLRVSNGNVRVSLVVVNGIESVMKHADEYLHCWSRIETYNLSEQNKAIRLSLLKNIAQNKIPSVLKPLLRARSKSELYRKVINILRKYFENETYDECCQYDPSNVAGDFITIEELKYGLDENHRSSGSPRSKAIRMSMNMNMNQYKQQMPNLANVFAQAKKDLINILI